MELETLKENIRNFNYPNYGRVQRDGAAYVATDQFVRRGLKICLMLYRNIKRLDQNARLLRDTIDFLLRRYHGYAIKQQFKAHYREKNLQHNATINFEHVIPASTLTALLIQGKITTNLAMNPPTCLLSKEHHDQLEKAGLGERTPDVWLFWRRYKDLGIEIETHQGDPVDLSTWNLGDHIKYFDIKL